MLTVKKLIYTMPTEITGYFFAQCFSLSPGLVQVDNNKFQTSLLMQGPRSTFKRRWGDGKGEKGGLGFGMDHGSGRVGARGLGDKNTIAPSPSLSAAM